MWSTGQKYQHFCIYLNKKYNHICYWNQLVLVVHFLLLFNYNQNYSYLLHNYTITSLVSKPIIHRFYSPTLVPHVHLYKPNTWGAQPRTALTGGGRQQSCLLPFHGRVRLSISSNTKSCERPFSRSALVQLKPVLLKEEKGRCLISTLKKSNLQKNLDRILRMDEEG